MAAKVPQAIRDMAADSTIRKATAPYTFNGWPYDVQVRRYDVPADLRRETGARWLFQWIASLRTDDIKGPVTDEMASKAVLTRMDEPYITPAEAWWGATKMIQTAVTGKFPRGSHLVTVR